MASTTNNSGISGDDIDEFGPDEKWDDETEDQFRQRMAKKEEAKKLHADYLKTRTPPCIG